MRSIPVVLAIIAAAAAASSVEVLAASPSAQKMTGEQAVGVVFSDVEKRLIRAYFEKHADASVADETNDGSGNSKKMPPGLAKREHLPPGLQKHLEKNGALPPGLAKRDLPANLVAELPPAHAGTLRQIVGNDVVLIQEGTNIVLDILENVLRKN